MKVLIGCDNFDVANEISRYLSWGARESLSVNIQKVKRISIPVKDELLILIETHITLPHSPSILDLVRMVREHEYTVPIIVLGIDEESAPLFKEAGVTAFVPYAGGPEVFLQAIASVYS